MAATDFPRFTELPVELQMQVWKEAAKDIFADIAYRMWHNSYDVFM